MKQYKSVFFDLDHTLWDYDTNSYETLAELYSEHQISEKVGIEFQNFHDSFQQVNLKLWDQYDRGFIDREVIRNDRFKMVLSELGNEDHNLAFRLGNHYSILSPTKKNLVPNTLEVLNYLLEKYPLYLVTNGFEEMQSTKVESGGIRKYFKDVITSERAGHKKPAKEIFDFTLQLGGLDKEEVIMVGDNLLTDIAGASNAGIDSVLYNPKRELHQEKVTFEITSLLELKSIL
jgi:putative hydrolase of the HAD superfamily